MVERLDYWPCQYCGFSRNTATKTFDRGPPVEGELTCCQRCGAIHRLKGGRWCLVSKRELAVMPLSVREPLERMQTTIRRLWQDI